MKRNIIKEVISSGIAFVMVFIGSILLGLSFLILYSISSIFIVIKKIGRKENEICC